MSAGSESVGTQSEDACGGAEGQEVADVEVSRVKVKRCESRDWYPGHDSRAPPPCGFPRVR